MSNLSANAVDNEALTDSFVMESITSSLTVDAAFTWDGYEQLIGDTPIVFIPPGHDVAQFKLLKKTKLRRQASPFGFGLTSAEFTFKQKSILAALLFSRKVPKVRLPGLSK
jgi:hypothetical protein